MKRLLLILPIFVLFSCIGKGGGKGQNISFEQAQHWYDQNSDKLQNVLEKIAACKPIAGKNDVDTFIPANSNTSTTCSNGNSVQDLQNDLSDLKLIGVEVHRVENVYRAKFIFYSNSYWKTDEITSIAYEPPGQKFKDSNTELRPLDSSGKWFWSRYAGG